jgi:ascorbate-specific PTS system EIIC-type component UlaA
LCLIVANEAFINALQHKFTTQENIKVTGKSMYFINKFFILVFMNANFRSLWGEVDYKLF